MWYGEDGVDSIYTTMSEERLLHSSRNRDYEVMLQLTRASAMDRRGKKGGRGSFIRSARSSVGMEARNHMRAICSKS